MAYKNGFKRYMDSHGLTAREVGEQVGISLHTVRAYMQGTRFPGRKTIKEMSNVFHLPVETVYKWFE